MFNQLMKAKTLKCQQSLPRITKCSQTKKINKKTATIIAQVQIIGGKKAKMISNSSSNQSIKVLQFNCRKSLVVRKTTSISRLAVKPETKKVVSSNRNWIAI